MASQTTLRNKASETLESAVAAFLDEAIVVRQTGCTAIVECKMCGQQDENHEESCPVPAMEQWLFDAAKDALDGHVSIEQAWNDLGISLN